MELTAQKREKFGKAVKSLRRAGLIPAELYGHNVANEHLSVPAKEFAKVFETAGENTVINVLVDGERRPALIYDVKKNPLSGQILNVDFYQVRMDERIRTRIPIDFLGEAPAVKELSGILIEAMHEIEVEALPMNLPKDIPITLGGLDALGKSIYVRDLKPIEGVRFLVDADTVIATVKEPAAEEEKVEAPTAEVAPAPEVAVPPNEAPKEE